MSYRIPVNKNTPRGMEGTFARLAHDESVSRAKQLETQRAEERQREQRKKANLEAVRLQTEERKRQLAESTRLAAARALDHDLEVAFFSQNPSASSSTFQRLLPGLRDDYMKKQTLESFETFKNKKRLMGGYSF